MCGCRCSKPSNLERFSEDARSPLPTAARRQEGPSFGCDSLSPLGLSAVPFQSSPQLAGEGPAHPPPSATLSGAREEAGGFVCANCIVRAKVLALGCLIWGLY